MSDIIVTLGGASLAAARFAPIHRAFVEVFSQPPSTWDEFEPDRHRERLTRLMTDPTFAVSVAECGPELVGFAYGRTVSPDNPRLTDFIDPLPPETAQEWEGRTFILVDFAVRERWRGRGVGRRLMDTLLAARTEERAILGVEPGAEDSQAIYTHLGWRRLGRKRQLGNFIPYMDIYLLPLREHAGG
jgi:GNAT superfamily N-acetyltransferase